MCECVCEGACGCVSSNVKDRKCQSVFGCACAFMFGYAYEHCKKMVSVETLEMDHLLKRVRVRK